MNSVRLILSAGVGLIGMGVSVFALSTFDQQITAEARRLHQAQHRSALKIITRDVDDLRRQLTQLYRRVPASTFEFLFFDRNDAGRMGVHGPSSGTWTPISNAYTSIFRAAFEGVSDTAIRVLDLKGNLIDANPTAGKIGPRSELADYVGGTNLVVRSSAIPSRAIPAFRTLVLLALLFWVDVALFIYFITPESEPNRPLGASRPLALPARGYRLGDGVVVQGIRDQHYRRI